MDKDTQDYLESLVSKIEKLSGLDNWEEIIEKYNLDPIKAKEAYDNNLDELYPMFMDFYYPSDILREVDPIAYNVGFQDFLSNEVSDGIGIEKNDFMFYQHDLENLLEKIGNNFVESVKRIVK